MNDWQPIETAPKNGTKVIVGYDFATVWIVHAAWWRSEKDVEMMVDGSPEDVGWWSYVEHSVTQTKLDGTHTPTHWQLLPEPPR